MPDRFKPLICANPDRQTVRFSVASISGD